jgi:hypothetical protein
MKARTFVLRRARESSLQEYRQSEWDTAQSGFQEGLPVLSSFKSAHGNCNVHLSESPNVRFRVIFEQLHVAFPGVRPTRTRDNRPRAPKSAVRA